MSEKTPPRLAIKYSNMNFLILSLIAIYATAISASAAGKYKTGAQSFEKINNFNRNIAMHPVPASFVPDGDPQCLLSGMKLKFINLNMYPRTITVTKNPRGYQASSEN
jgi:hypothetical protein